MFINPKSKIQNPKSKPRLLLAFLSVTLIAAFFRFYHLADHPLGLFFDPAINGLDAIRLMQRGGPVIFFPTNGGREAVLIYLLIPFLWLFGTNPFSFRLQLAIISLLTVVFLFGFLRDKRLVIGNWRLVSTPITNYQLPLPNLYLATLASLILAVSYWHISISRLDQRPLTVPLLSVPVFWFFFKGWTSGQRHWFILSGLVVGLGLHTYSAARLLPVILLLTFLPELLLTLRSSHIPHPTSHIPHHLSGLALFIATALLVAAPMLWYFVTHPAQFTARAASVMVWNYLNPPADILAELGRNTLRVLGFFCCIGSPNAIFGLPGYFGGLSPVLTPFLFIGLILALKNWRNLFFRLVALWWLIGILPSIIAIEAPHPLRMIVAVVPTAILVAFGLIYATAWLQARYRLQVAGSRSGLQVASNKSQITGGRVASSKVADVTRFTPHVSRLTLHASRFTLPPYLRHHPQRLLCLFCSVAQTTSHPGDL